MKILRDVDLKPFNTFGVSARCRAMVKLNDRAQLPAIMALPEYLPNNVMTNHDLEKLVDTSDQWIRERTGIEQRHIAADGETAHRETDEFGHVFKRHGGLADVG